MAKVEDVAVFIINETQASGMRLQKLLYYAQAWSLAWDGAPLFDGAFEAWRDGPVSRVVYGQAKYDRQLMGDSSALTAAQTINVRAVLDFYGSKSAEWLSRLTHREQPWRAARNGLPPEASSSAEISQSIMRSFYQSHGQSRSFEDAYQRGLDVLVEMPEDEALLVGDGSSVSADDYLAWLEHGDDSPTN